MGSTPTIAIDTNWSNIIPKDNSIQAVQTAGKGLGTKMWAVSVTLGSSQTYTTGGITLSLDPKNQIIDEYLAVIPISTTAAVEFQYTPNATGNSGVLQCYTAAASTNSATALAEVANGSTILESKVFKFLVIAS